MFLSLLCSVHTVGKTSEIITLTCLTPGVDRVRIVYNLRGTENMTLLHDIRAVSFTL